MKTTADQLQLDTKESKNEKAKLEMQKIKLQNLVKNFRDNNIEYNKLKQAIEGQIEYVLADRRRLVRTAVQSVIEILRADPQGFHTFYYNRSTRPENNEEPLLVEVEQLYEKMLGNMTNKVVTSLSDDMSPASIFAQEAFHPNFEAIKNDSNETPIPLYDSTVIQVRSDHTEFSGES